MICSDCRGSGLEPCDDEAPDACERCDGKGYILPGSGCCCVKCVQPGQLHHNGPCRKELEIALKENPK